MSDSAVTPAANAAPIFAEGKYGIDSSEDAAHIFGILRNQVYSDKILAVIREYSTNAADAHLEAGYPEKSISVHLPSWSCREFRVRDFGRGLSPDDVMQVYCKYGRSKKRGLQGYNGQLGLGSKSAFAYTDTWTITSYYDGKKYIFNSLIDESEIGVVTLIYEGPTDEPNGIEICIPVKSGEETAFIRTAERFYRTFYPSPQVKCASEFNISFPTPMIKSGRVELYSVNDQIDGPLLIMGNVAYPVNTDWLVGWTADPKYRLEGDAQDFIQHNYRNIVIQANPNDVVIAASREALDYREKTKLFIREAMSGAIAGLSQKVLADSASMPTLFDRINFIKKFPMPICADFRNSLIKDGQLVIDDKTYPTRIKIPDHDTWGRWSASWYNDWDSKRGNYRYRPRLVSRKLNLLADDVQSFCKYVVFDIPVEKAGARLKALIQENGRASGESYIGLSADDISTVIAAMAPLEPSFWCLASSLPEPSEIIPVDEMTQLKAAVVRAPAYKIDKAKRQALFLEPEDRLLDTSAKSRNWKVATTFSETDENFYVELENFRLKEFGPSITNANIKALFNDLIQSKALPKNAKLYGVRVKDVPDAIEMGANNLRQYLAKKVADIPADYWVKFNNSSNENIKLMRLVGVPLPIDSATSTQYDWILSSRGTLGRLHIRISDQDNHATAESWMDEFGQAVRQLFPVLGLTIYGRDTAEGKKIITDYVKMVMAGWGIS